jgi:hypothetical protein
MTDPAIRSISVIRAAVSTAALFLMRRPAQFQEKARFCFASNKVDNIFQEEELCH